MITGLRIAGRKKAGKDGRPLTSDRLFLFSEIDPYLSPHGRWPAVDLARLKNDAIGRFQRGTNALHRMITGQRLDAQNRAVFGYVDLYIDFVSQAVPQPACIRPRDFERPRRYHYLFRPYVVGQCSRGLPREILDVNLRIRLRSGLSGNGVVRYQSGDFLRLFLLGRRFICDLLDWILL